MDRATTFTGPVFNFRDVGGLTSADGRRVRSGRLFRSDSLGGLRDTDLAAYHPDAAPLEPYIASTPAIAMATFPEELRLRYGSARDYVISQGLTAGEIDTLRATLLTESALGPVERD